MTTAAGLELTTGSLVLSAPSGKIVIQANETGQLVIVDDQGTQMPISGVSNHQNLAGNNDPNQHPIDAITGLITALAGKVPMSHLLAPNPHNITKEKLDLGNVVNVDWTDIINDAYSELQNHINNHTNPHNTTPDHLHIEPQEVVCLRNEITQSHRYESELLIEWNKRVINTNPSIFVHDPDGNSSEEILINYDGLIELSYNINLESDESNRIFAKTKASLDFGNYPETVCYGYCRHHSYVDRTSMTIPCVVMPVTAGQIMRVHSEIAYNDDSNSFGDTERVATVFGESFITLKTLPLP